MTLHFLPVQEQAGFQAVETLAFPIWREHYTPIIGAAQVEYMLEKFQTEKAVQEQVKRGDLYSLIQTPDGENAGFLSVAYRPQELFLSKLYIQKIHRGKGFAREALEFIKGLAKEKGLKRITLTVHKQNPSVKVYQAMGFEILGPVVTDIGNGFVMDDYRMALTF